MGWARHPKVGFDHQSTGGGELLFVDLSARCRCPSHIRRNLFLGTLASQVRLFGGGCASCFRYRVSQVYSCANLSMVVYIWSEYRGFEIGLSAGTIRCWWEAVFWLD